MSKNKQTTRLTFNKMISYSSTMAVVDSSEGRSKSIRENIHVEQNDNHSDDGNDQDHDDDDEGVKESLRYSCAGIEFQKQVRKEKRIANLDRLKWNTFKSKSERKFSDKDDIYDLQSSLTFPPKSVDEEAEAQPLLQSDTPSLLIQKTKVSHYVVLQDMVTGSYINLLLLLFPFALASYYFHWSPTAIFVLNFLVMIPLASLLGDFTEEVAAHTNQTIGGLINASFGNAVEVVVAIQALLVGEYRVVQASMIGSIFSNLLLVLGCCFFFGGLRHKQQSYSQLTATANMGLLGLSCIALVLPTPFAEYYQVDDEDALLISRISAVFLICMYAQLLLFQLKTHAEFFKDEGNDEISLPFYIAIGGLVVVTLIIAKLSGFLVDSIDGFCAESGVSRTFTGLIIIPIVGNAVEHITAVNVAMKNKMDLAMGVAVGSATQISLFVTPLIVIIGWMTDRPMTINFPPFEIILFSLSVIVVSIIISYPHSNWLQGSLLITTYVMIAVGFWFEKVVDYTS
jgi:Ca2+:H+ antiporter